MMGKTHIAGGAILGSTALLLMQHEVPSFSTINTGITAGTSLMIFPAVCPLLCDIDEKNSTIGRKLFFVSWPIYLLQLILKIPAMFGIRIFKKISNAIDHRGFTHYPSTWLILTAMAAFYGYIMYNKLGSCSSVFYIFLSPAAGLSIGILSHIILDLFSGKIRIFAPFSDKRYGLPIVKEGGLIELIIRITLYIGTIKILYIYLCKILS